MTYQNAATKRGSTTRDESVSPMVDVIARFTRRRNGWRWRCHLCADWADTPPGVDEIWDYERHYQDKHQGESR
jgi:hypothetical protein